MTEFIKRVLVTACTIRHCGPIGPGHPGHDVLRRIAYPAG